MEQKRSGAVQGNENRSTVAGSVLHGVLRVVNVGLVTGSCTLLKKRMRSSRHPLLVVDRNIGAIEMSQPSWAGSHRHLFYFAVTGHRIF